MAKRKPQYIVIEDTAKGGVPLGIYIANTPQQALNFHVRPLNARVLTPGEANELMFPDPEDKTAAFRPIEVPE